MSKNTTNFNKTSLDWIYCIHIKDSSKSTKLIFNHLFGMYSVPLRNESCKKEANPVNLVVKNLPIVTFPNAVIPEIIVSVSLSLCHCYVFFSFHILNYESITERSCW